MRLAKWEKRREKETGIKGKTWSATPALPRSLKATTAIAGLSVGEFPISFIVFITIFDIYGNQRRPVAPMRPKSSMTDRAID